MKQREMSLLGSIKPPRHLTDEELKTIHSEHEALIFCLEHGRFKFQKDIADVIGIKSNHLSLMKSGVRHWPLNKIDKIQYASGLFAFDDYRALVTGLRTIEKTSEEILTEQIEDLRSQIKELKAS